MEKITLHLGNCLSRLRNLPSHSVDLVVTSPPYDSLRTYGGGMKWDLNVFKAIAKELARVLKKGGVIVWNVSDECIKGSYSCTSMRQILYFIDELGLNLHDDMIWEKSNPFIRKRGKRYHAAYEHMYILSNGEPKTFNPIMRECKNGGKEYTSSFLSQMGNGHVDHKHGVTPMECIDYNVWRIPTATSKESTYTLKSGRKIHHTAVFPKELVLRHITTWTNEGDVVLDPFMGSGTSGLAALELGRGFIGCELNKDYYQMASERIADKVSELGMEECKVSDEDFLTPKQLVKVNVGQQHMKLYVQRVERIVYDKLHLSELHYIKDPINKGATCLLFTDLKGRNVAFVGLLNNPSRTYPNAVIVSRIIVLPQFQGKGLSIPILDVVGAMLAAKGLQLFINTEKKSFGKRLDSSVCWEGTTFDKKVRKYYSDDATHRNRKGGIMWRKRFVGKALHGYSEHFEKVAVLRDKRDGLCIEDGVVSGDKQCLRVNMNHSVMQHAAASEGSSSAHRRTGAIALSAASHGAYISSVGEGITNKGCVLVDITSKSNLNIVEYGYRDTS